MDDILTFDSTEYFFEDNFTEADPATEIQVEERNLDEAAESAPENISDSVSDNSVSSNEIIELLTEINNNLKEIKSYDERNLVKVQGNDSSDSIPVKYVSDDQAEYLTVSENNILTKPINDYTVSESFLFVISLVLIFGGIALIIKKGLPRWR